MTLLILIGLCGCSNNGVSDITPITNGFKCDFSIAGSDLSGVLSVNNEGDLSIVFSGPDIINNVGIRVKEESVIIEVQGISQRYSRNDAPNDSPALHIYDALIAMQTLSPTANDEAITIHGKSQTGEFCAYLNGTGYITELHFDSIETVVVLKNHINDKQ